MAVPGQTLSPMESGQVRVNSSVAGKTKIPTVSGTHWLRVSAWLLLVVSLGAVELLSQANLLAPHPAIVLYLDLVVLYVAFAGGLGAALSSGLVTMVYVWHYLSGSDLSRFDRDTAAPGFWLVLVSALVPPVLALTVGLWKRSAASALASSRAQAILKATVVERRRGDDALRRTEANYRSLIEHAPCGILRATRDGNFLMVNAALVRMLGYASKSELLAANFAAHIDQNLGERPRMLAPILKQDRFEGAEVEWKRKDGTPITVRLSGRLARDAQGALAYFDVVAENLSEAPALAPPPVPPPSLAALSREEPAEPPGRRRYTDPVPPPSLAAPVVPPRQVAAVSREELRCAESGPATRDRIPETGPGPRGASPGGVCGEEVVPPELLNLSAVVADLERELRRVLGEDVKLVTMLDPALGRARADQEQLARVILNLVANAREAMPDGGKLILKTANVDLDKEFARRHPPLLPGRYVTLAVSDTGCGMDAETQLRSFEPFFTTKESSHAVGLGLTAVWGIVKQSGGYLWVHSEPGQGATFKVYLPRVEEMAVSGSPAPP